MTATGVGVGFRKAIADDILASDDGIVSFLEIVPENYVGRGGTASSTLSQIAERWPILAHGVSMSLGGPDPFDDAYIKGLKAVLDLINAPFYTDHLCYATVDGFATHELLPMPFNGDAVRHTATRIRELSERLERPIAVENIAYYATMPGSVMSGAEFVRNVVEEADCGLLFDVNNLFVNAQNHGFDPLKAMAELPVERTVQFHVAGHVQEGPRLLDNHGRPVDERVLSLYEAALKRTGPKPTLLEWDLDIPSLAEVLQDVARVRTVYDRNVDVIHLQSQPPSVAPRPETGNVSAFFGAIRGFLLGEYDASALEDTLGPSPSGLDNLSFYPRFLRRHERLTLGRLFPAAKALLDAHDIDWFQVCAEYIRDCVPSHWSLHRTGEAFADWYSHRVQAGAPWPEEAAYLADYAWTCWLAHNAPPQAPLLDGTVFVRRYPVDVKSLRQAVLAGETAQPSSAVTLLVYRHVSSGKVFSFEASLGTLAALDQLGGTGETDWAAYGVKASQIDKERKRLLQRGVVASEPSQGGPVNPQAQPA